MDCLIRQADLVPLVRRVAPVLARHQRAQEPGDGPLGCETVRKGEGVAGCRPSEGPQVGGRLRCHSVEVVVVSRVRSAETAMVSSV